MADLRLAYPNNLAPVGPLTTYTSMVTVLPLTAAKPARSGVRWYDEALLLLGTSMGVFAATSLAAPTVHQHVAVSPATAAWGAPITEVQGVAYGEQYKLDDMGLVLGDTGDWVVGGELDQEYGFTVERSSDGGETWDEVRDASLVDPWLPVGPIPTAVLYDNEAPLNVPLRYRARTRKVVEVS